MSWDCTKCWRVKCGDAGVVAVYKMCDRFESGIWDVGGGGVYGMLEVVGCMGCWRWWGVWDVGGGDCD